MCIDFTRIAVLVIAVVSSGLVAGGARAGAPQLPAEADRLALAEFDGRIRAYTELHRRVEGPLPPVQVSSDPAEVQRAMDRLAQAIRDSRPGAHQGDIFSPEIAVVFRRLIREGCGGNLRELLAIVTEEVERPLPAPRVHARWPPDAPFSMIPPAVLCALPALPGELEFRFINRDLVLWDVHADLIVDFIKDAIPKHTGSPPAGGLPCAATS
jgi:hypothetical protein